MYSQFIKVLKELRRKIIMNEFGVREINNDLYAPDYIKKAISFDNEETCFDMRIDMTSAYVILLVLNINYGIFYDDELVGLYTIGDCAFSHDKTVKEISCVLNKKYRGMGICTTFLNDVLNDYLEKYGFSSIHSAVRVDNIYSQKALEKAGFKQYEGYLDDRLFMNSSGKKTPQIQYLLKREDIKKSNK